MTSLRRTDASRPANGSVAFTWQSAVSIIKPAVLSADRPDDVDEVFHYVGAMNHGLERLRTLPVSVRLIREIHERLLSGVRGHHLTPGALRTSQNWIGPAGCTLAEATFVPPPPHEVPRLMGELERFLHVESPLPLLIRIGLAHAQFETIHPFIDGNGRIGRLLVTFLLCEKKVLGSPCCISRTISNATGSSTTTTGRQYATRAPGSSGSSSS